MSPLPADQNRIAIEVCMLPSPQGVRIRAKPHPHMLPVIVRGLHTAYSARDDATGSPGLSPPPDPGDQGAAPRHSRKLHRLGRGGREDPPSPHRQWLALGCGQPPVARYNEFFDSGHLSMSLGFEVGCRFHFRLSRQTPLIHGDAVHFCVEHA